MGDPEHDLFDMSRSADGVVRLTWHTGVAAHLEEARSAIAQLEALTGGVRAPLLVDARAMGPYDRDARRAFVRHGDLVTAVAILVENPLGRLMANFFLAVSRPVAPTRLFETEDEALAWLKEMSR
jgi:hypothetical protein